MRKTFILVAALLGVLACNAQVVDFEDLNLDENSSWMGEAGVDGFSSSYLTLYNEYDEMYNSFQGFAYTNVTDVETYSYTSIASSSSNNDGNYVTAFVGNNWMDGSYDPIPVSVKIDRSAAPSFENRGAYFCLTTYTSMYMDDAQFGGNYAA
ncbi:MAG: hypothetical protein HUK15_10030, partial [Bacteroidales bacterium]|nr:hypothetical protein [Bacteroidales bacterium]